MNRINIDITKAELDFIRESIQTKTQNILDHLNDCEWVAKSNQPEIKQQINQAATNLFQKEYKKYKKPHWTQTPAGKRKLAARKRSKK